MWRAGPRLADSRVVAGRSHAVDGVNEVGRQSSPMQRRPDASPQVSALYQQFHTATSGFDSRHLHCPGLRSRRSGDIKAAIPLATGGGPAAWSHPGRVRSEAAFASLAGVNPIPASSGNTVRHRINRGGDRRLNRALHMAVVTRIRMDPRTRAYVDRRTAEGRTLREIRRCLKRYLARQIYRHLNAAAQSAPITP